MEFFKHNTAINFMAQRRLTAAVSIVLCLSAIVILMIKGLNWGLDFTGGRQLQLRYATPPNLTEIHDSLEKAGFADAVVMSYGSPREVLVTMPPKDESHTESTNASQALAQAVVVALPGATLEEVNYIGPQVGREMVSKGVVAVLFALLGTMVYIAIRFNIRFAIGSTVALIHDPIIILGIFSLFHIEFNLIALAAVLTVIGYSLNDTIVIYDRVRENFRKSLHISVREVMNQAINQTLSRTIMTSALTLTVVLALFFLGGATLHGFALAMIVGIVVGTYSSIYVAGSLTLALGLQRDHFLKSTRLVDGRP
jgi:preprotein translocase subunit SecF